MSIIEDLKRHEGFRSKPYKDSVGKLTIGYGLNLDAGISQSEATMILEHRVRLIYGVLQARLPFFANLSQKRKESLVNMAYNLGIDGLMEFKKTLTLIEEGKYSEAAVQMLKSKWATQVGKRAEELADMMDKG